MRTIFRLIVFVAVCSNLPAQTPETSPSMKTNATKLTSMVIDWEKMQPTPTSNGVRRAVFDGPTATLDKLHCHITTLNPGEVSGPPRLHLQEEVIIVKEGRVEATADGHSQIGGPGSVIFFASGAITSLRNAGDGPATYTVVYYYTPLTPKN
jgi:quercetin dioxygenase-like cupin family protein